MPSPDTLVLFEKNQLDRPLVFLLDGTYFSMDLTAAFAPQLPAPGEPPTEPIEAWAEGLAEKLVQPFQQPMSIKDVTFLVHEDTLTLVLWKRLRGFRVAPVTIQLSQISDPQAAADFADLVKERTQFAPQPGRYTGPLEYLGTWVLMGAAAAGGFYGLTRLLCR